MSRLEPFPAVDGRVCQPLRVSDAVTTQLEHATHKQNHKRKADELRPTARPSRIFSCFFFWLGKTCAWFGKKSNVSSLTNKFFFCMLRTALHANG